MFPLFKIFNRLSFVNANIKSDRRFLSEIARNMPLNKFNFSMRSLKISEFKEILSNWAVKEGWNPGKHEYLPFYLANLNGHKGIFFNDKIIASLSAVRYSKDLAYLGIYIVDPNYREQGVGQILAKATLKELADCPLIGINAVQQQVSNYQRKYGFVSSHSNSRWTGEFKIQNNFVSRRSEMDIKIVGRDGLDINELIDYDASIFSVPRVKFLRKWIEMPESYLLAAIKSEKICGYGVISKCINGYKIAPLFANDKEIAQRLYASFAYILQGKRNIVQLDVPENNQTAVKLATQFGLYKTFETRRMYKSKEPLIEEPNNSNVYAITTLEIG
jgi:Acetyltransferase (GNAT) domain/Acetyltransferase (GNAT) family